MSLDSYRSRASFRCEDIAPDGLFDWDEDVIAIRVDALGKVALHADALDDIELAGTLPEEDSRGLPGCGQNLRREDLKIHMHDVLLGEMDALDHPHVAIVRQAGRLAHGERHLRKNVHGVDREGLALPMPDRMAVEGRVSNVRMGTAVGI